jgi:cell division protein FtsI/penicillin-binding protein 2
MSTQHIYSPNPEDWIPPEEKAKKKKEPRIKPQQRINLLMMFMAVIAALLGLQLIRHQVFGMAPEEIAMMDSPKLHPRGAIVDTNGHPLAIQRFRYEVVASPKIMTKKGREIIANELAPLIGMDPYELHALFEEYAKKKESVILKNAVPPEVGEEIISKDYAGIGVYIYPVRFHPEGSLASHVLGFVSVDNIGRYGLEDYFNSFLVAPTTKILPKPTPHMEDEDSDVAVEDVLPNSPFIPSLAQRDLVLTLDRTLQYVAETALKKGIEKYKADSGVVIIMDPKTSAVLAMAGYPDYNPDEYADVESEDLYVNPAISDIYEPGSVFKLITFAAALDQGVITPETRYLDTDKFIYQQQVVQNWDRKGRG